ncbi:maleate cis-trans isomerase family protein [Paraburkholderia diazotrophica]|uniref:Maleate isomerase n=1 Tax=Paraburkholderia diazotrophica TaxID=667676 RepID=A0A1H7EPF1_9BURK|nr:aspartate/glutamate racemase family protein [Paraburkholderia diazotrophica]SEK12605.1 maleate isomerase [Paraburkholderia diazotrophica]
MTETTGFEARLDGGRHDRAKTGFVLLATEQTIEDDMFTLLPKGVGIHFTRVPNPDSITRESLDNIASSLADAAARILPDGSLDVICYGCTSGSLVVGEKKVFAELTRGAPNAKTTSMITAVIRGLRAVGAKRIVIGTPYLDEINVMEKSYLENEGFDVLAIHGLQLEKDSDMVRVTPESIVQMALFLDRPDADAILISCGALRSIEVIEEIEQRTGKPVITSNQAVAWDVMRLAGLPDRIDGYGRLLSLY